MKNIADGLELKVGLVVKVSPGEAEKSLEIESFFNSSIFLSIGVKTLKLAFDRAERVTKARSLQGWLYL